MNKKVLFSLIFIISFSCIWAVWEGNGGIGSPTDFPSGGLFVRSDMFPKHTLLEITNLEKSIKARAVVIGPSGIPGLLVSLSPELGEKLLVPRGKVIRIRVLTPSPVNEEEDANNSAATGPESQDLDTNPALFVASHIESPAEESATTEKLEDPQNADGLIEILPPPEAPLEKKAEEETVPSVEPLLLPAAEEKTEPVEIIPESSVKEVEEVKTEPVEVISQPPVKPVAEKIIPPEEVAPIETETYMEPAKENPPITVAAINEPEVKKEEPTAAVSEIDEPQEPEKTKETVEDVEFIEPVSEPVEEAPDEEKKVEVIASILPKAEPAPVKEEPAPIEEEPVPVEEVPSPNEEIPAEEIPSEEAEDPETYEENDADIYAANEEKPEEETTVIVNEIKPASGKLENGKTYVQIVVYNDKYNRDEVLKKYGKTYPMVVEESFVKNNTKYTIFVGPLKPQETGAVLERFKQLGFKDAFLKKGK
ncbi:SPOR domain-containing protein [Treponema sp. OMZ 788]|uniref:SPOR domain-containing protein n=1 Tax=Treponema sp. OMZ 788 TaxID=2563664 RepID=UPI0020A35D4A|nr:SPOR domain-containing protein [Treponema sp. OMZ 788]UTC63818.1 SPOR domain-containing protein [Treponema sp. OMZ 788]